MEVQVERGRVSWYLALFLEAQIQLPEEGLRKQPPPTREKRFVWLPLQRSVVYHDREAKAAAWVVA